MTMRKGLPLLLLLLTAGLSACRGGDDNAPIWPSDSDTADGDVDSDAASQADGDADSETVVTRLTCPHPASLPFTLESDAFLNADSTNLADTSKYPFYLDQNLDVIGLPDAAQEIDGLFARGDNSLVGDPFAGEWTSLWTAEITGTWQQLNRLQTDANGAYAVTLASPTLFTKGTHAVYGILEGDKSCAAHGIFLWPENTKVIITDIDGTLTTDDNEFLQQMSDQSYDPKENTSASEMINAWTKKGYQVVYLTARGKLYRAPTRYWLEAHKFPFMPVVTAPAMVYGDSARAYKREWVKKIVNDFKWQVVAAYGNADSDIAAYDDAGIAKSVTFIIGEFAGASGTVAINNNDYTSHISDFIDKQPDADPGF